MVAGMVIRSRFVAEGDTSAMSDAELRKLEDLERRVHEAEARRLQRVRAMCQNLEKPPEV